jgi:N-methylhydantoinase B
MSQQTLRKLSDADFRARYGCDRFVATVLGNRFHYILEHMCERLLACAFSPVLRDFYDFAATLTGAPEQHYPTPAVSKTFIAFTGTMTESVRITVEEYGVERLQPGDVLIGNDPYRTGTHVNDLLFILPVFVDGRIVAFVNLKAHQLDMGGAVPGGFSSTKANTYENGLVLSPRLLLQGGKPVRETWNLIGDNVRFAELLARDMQTLIACLRMGESLLQESIRRYGVAAVQGAMDYRCDADAEQMAAAIAALPDGDWRGEAMVDADGRDATEEYPVRVLIRKRGDRLEVDVSDTARQARTCINGTWLDTKTVVGAALKFMLDPNGAFTSGTYRPVDIVIPDGAICSALPPDGAVFAYGESTNALLAAMFQAMSSALGENAIAGDHGAPNLHTGVGLHPNGQLWVAIGVAGGESGPWGATRHGDADSFSKFSQANSMDTPIEAVEADYPLAIMRREYMPDTGGAGYNRGGNAVLRDSLWFQDATHSLITLRFKQPSGFGVLGGNDGLTGGVWLWQPQQKAGCAQLETNAQSFASATPVAGRLEATTNLPDFAGDYVYFGQSLNWPTQAGASFRYVTNAGGGWKQAFTREPQRVLDDVRNGYVSIEGARRDYGVVIHGDAEWDPEGLQLDAEATTALRAG